MRELKKPNDISILNDFFDADMRFIVLDMGEDKIGPYRYATDMETGDRILFVTYGPELYE